MTKGKYGSLIDLFPKLPSWLLWLVAAVTAIAEFILFYQGHFALVTGILLLVVWLVCLYVRFARAVPQFGGKGAFAYPKARDWALVGISAIPASVLTLMAYSYLTGGTPLLSAIHQSNRDSSTNTRPSMVSFEFNPALKWHQGESKTNSYELGQRPLVITAGSWTNQYSNVSTAPMVMYPVRGDFDARVMLVFHPTEDQYAGIGIRSTVNSYTWLRVTRARDGKDVLVYSTNDNGQFAYGDQVEYSSDIVYLRIVRQGALFQLSCSPGGNAWNPIGEPEMEFPDEVEIYFLALSASSDIAVARFQGFEVIQ